MTRLAAWAAAVILLAPGLAWGVSNSGYSQVLDENGRLHRVEVEPWSCGGKILGTALRHTIMNPDGTRTSTLIPGTDEPASDREPVLRIDPSTDEPVLAWSRNDGVSFDIYVAQYREGVWSAPRAVPSTGGDDLAPQLQIGFHHDHLVYRTEYSGERSWNRLVLDRATLEPVFGPETLPTSSTPISSAGSGADATWGAEPPFWDFFFASEVFRATVTDPGTILVWGVRDDPMPIDYVQSFQCPAGIRDAQQPEAGYLAGRFALRYVSGDRFSYVLRNYGSWSELRFIELSDKVSSDSARLMLRDMILRGWIP